MLPHGFWEKVQVGKKDQCWPWLAHTCHGYGHVRVGPKVKKAHRLVYEEAHGPIPDGLVVMHVCDNRRCVNERHLRLGTPKENNSDRDKKGRQVAKRGEAHGMSKLTEANIREIGVLRTEINSRVHDFAERFGVTPLAIRDVLAGKTWKWLKL